MVSGHGWNRAKIIQTATKPLALAIGSANNKRWEDWSEFMIRIENVKVFNMEGAIRGMRNPMNSWDKSDSVDGHIGDNDFALMKRLFDAGTEHRKYLRQIFVTCDILAPLYWWKEADQFRIGVTTNSCSTMHRLMAKPFEMCDFSFDQLIGYKKEVKQFRPVVDEDMVANEKWVSIDDDYDVSNYGRVKHKLNDRYRLISGSLHEDGYVFVSLHKKQTPLHRIVARFFHKETYKEGLVVNHIDGNKQNNFAENLEWVTQSENIRHSYKNNLQPKGLSTYKGKLSAKQRQEVKDLWDSGEMSKREIARKYGVSHTTICAITNDKYKYIDKVNVYEEVARPYIDILNELRDSYLVCNDDAQRKDIWWQLIQLLPSSYNQLRTVTMNYEVLANIIRQRKNHKLDEWIVFCKIMLEENPLLHRLMGDVKIGNGSVLNDK